MLRAAKWLALLSFVAVFTGCATVKNQPFNKEAHQNIKTIVILPAPPVSDYSINILYHPGASFGLVGGLIAAAEMGAKGSQFSSAMQAQKFDAGKALTEAVKAAVEQRGYTVVVAEGFKRPDAKLLETYGAVAVKGDAYLDFIVTAVGYSANSHTTPYYPMVSVPVRLVAAKDQAIVYNSLIVDGPGAGPKGATRLTPDSAYAVGSFSDLTDGAARSADGIRAAIQIVAKQIAADL